MMKSLFLAVLLIGCVPGWATSYYVDKNAASASDSNDGLSDTTSHAWLTIGRCAQNSNGLVAGDVCNITANGLTAAYDERVSVTNHAGSAGNVVTYLMSSGVIVRSFTVGKDYITIQGGEISNCKDASHTAGTACSSVMTTDTDYGVHINDGIGHLTISAISFHDTSNECLGNNTVDNTVNFLHVIGNTFAYCGESSDIIPNLGTPLNPNNFVITAGSNDQVKVSVQGGASQTVTITAGAYNSGYTTLAITPSLSGAEITCGDSGNCTVRSTTGGPASSISLQSVSNSAYATLGWTGAGAQCQSLPCAGVFEGHMDIANAPGVNALFENNTASHFNEFIQAGARTVAGSGPNSKLVLRNNTMGPLGHFSPDHHDGVLDGQYTIQVLFENNYAVNAYSSDTRIPFGLFEEATSSHVIIRYNYTYLSKGTFAMLTGGLTRFYNNDLGVNSKLYQGDTDTQLNFTGSASNNKAANNIWYAACCGSMNQDPYNSGAGKVSVVNDLYYLNAVPCVNGGCSSVSGLVGPADPLFVDVSGGDYHLTATSPALNAGAKLTTANGSGSSSTSFTATDPYWFQDGWAGINPDCVAIGTVGNVACIVSGTINYSTGAMTLDTVLTWSNGASVWLYRKSDGVAVLVGSAPDIGAFEYGTSITGGGRLRLR